MFVGSLVAAVAVLIFAWTWRDYRKKEAAGKKAAPADLLAFATVFFVTDAFWDEVRKYHTGLVTLLFMGVAYLAIYLVLRYAYKVWDEEKAKEALEENQMKVDVKYVTEVLDDGINIVRVATQTTFARDETSYTGSSTYWVIDRDNGDVLAANLPTRELAVEMALDVLSTRGLEKVSD